MWSLLGLAALLVAPSNALYFYLHSGEEKCFIEELPKDTLVVGMFSVRERFSTPPNTNTTLPGHYKGLQWDGTANAYTQNPAGLPVMVRAIPSHPSFNLNIQQD
jgi:hypothetical protein